MNQIVSDIKDYLKNVDTDITTVDTSVIQFDVNLESNVSKRRLRLANESPDDYIISHTTNSHKGLGKVKGYNNKKDRPSYPKIFQNYKEISYTPRQNSPHSPPRVMHMIETPDHIETQHLA